MNQFASIRLGAVFLVVSVCAACSSADERKANYLKRGQTYYEQQNYDKAGVELRNALQIDPKFVDARYMFAKVAERKSDVRAAAGQYLAIIDEDPKYAPARAAMARLYLLGGAIDQATELVEAGLKDSPDHPELLMMRGAIAARSGRMEQALQDAQAAYRLDPKSDLTVSLLASIYKQMNRIDDAVKVVEAGIGQIPKSVDLHVVLADLEGSRQHYDVVERELKKVVEIEPKVLGHRTRLFQFYRFRNDVASAEAVWRQAVKDLPDQQEARLALISFLWSAKGDSAATQEMQAMLAKDNDQNLKLEWGSFIARQGQPERAEKIFDEIIKDAGIKSAGLGARNRLAASHLSRNQSDKAAALVAEVLKENPRDNDALIMRANMAMAKGDAATAITDLRGVLRDQPNSTPLMRALARAHLQNNESSLAEETLRNALQNDPADVDTRKDLANLYMQQNKPEQARILLDELSKVPSAANELDVLESQFRAQVSVKDYAAAQQTIDRLQQQHADKALPYYLAGVLADAQNKPSEARGHYEQALVRQPDGAEPLAALTRLDVAQKQTQQALNRINKVIAEYPKNGVAYNLRGELLLSDKQIAAANAAFATAVSLTPAWWAPYRGLAMTQLAEKQFEAAVKTYQDGINQTKSAVLSSDLAVLFEQLKRPDDAIGVYQQWLQREPKSIMAANNLAMLLLNYRNDKDSLARAASLSEVLATSNDPAVLDTRGWIKFRNSDYQGALLLLEQAQKAAPNARVVRYHLGMAQLKAGDTQAAHDNLQMALRDGQPFFGIEDARQALDQLKSPG